MAERMANAMTFQARQATPTPRRRFDPLPRHLGTRQAALHIRRCPKIPDRGRVQQLLPRGRAGLLHDMHAVCDPGP